MLRIRIICPLKGWEKPRGGGGLHRLDRKANPNYTAKLKIFISLLLPIHIDLKF